MKTFSYLWQYLAELLLEWEMFQIKVVEKIQTHFMYDKSFLFSRKSFRLRDNVEKYGRVRETTDDVTIWRKHSRW